MPIVLNKHEIIASIKERYATIIYVFNFENINDNGTSDELKFEITIDPKAFIAKFEANIDGQLFVGKTKEKEKASKEYSAAKEKNENAILISQPHKNIPNVFEIKTNIDSKSKILLTIQIEQYLQKKFGFNVLNIQILRNFDKYNINENFKFISFKINVKDKSGIYDVIIPTTNTDDIMIDKQTIDKMNKKYEITGKIMEKHTNSNLVKIKCNELILKYKIRGESQESYILFDNKSNTFCHIISDIITNSINMDQQKDINNEGQQIDKIENNVLIPRRVMFVIDRSGSMRGSKWLKTISSTIMAIKKLRKGYDRFGIILFDGNIELLPYQDMRGCILSNDKTISDSIKALQNQNVKGTTNINDALLKAVELIKVDILLLNNDKNCKYNFFLNQIIFITDGEANNGETKTNKIISNVQKANELSKIDKYNNKISIFSFGVGQNENDSGWTQDLNHSFLKVLSVNNNGFYQRIKQSSADTSLSEYFDILSKPVLVNINIEYKNKNIKHLTNTKFNTLYAGNDLIICGKITNQENMNINCNLSLIISAISGKEIVENDKLITKPITIAKEMKININWKRVENDNDNDDINNIQRIWAYLKLQQFATQKLIYNDMIEIDDDEKKEDLSLPISLALKYKFVTPWTSMIVVKKKDKAQSMNKQQYGAKHREVIENMGSYRDLRNQRAVTVQKSTSNQKQGMGWNGGMRKLFGGFRKPNMRNTGTKQEEKKSAEIDKYLEELNQKQNKTISLLLLGPGGSGKSTVLKQMEKIYLTSIQNKTLKDAAQYVTQNILEDIYDLAIQNTILKASYPECQLREQSQKICTQITSIKRDNLVDIKLTPDLAKSLLILWNDKGLQKTYNIHKRSHIMDNTPYFFANIDRISNANYCPNFEDYIRVRHRTTGIIESGFPVNVDNNSSNKWTFKVTDVGGQRAERKKWLRCFTDINAIIYVMNLAAYDQTLFEDDTQNCYREALDVFERTMKHEALATVDVFVFLNKNDLFLTKITKVPFTVFEPNFNKDLIHNANAVKDYLRHEYKKRFYNELNAQKSPRRIHFHITCATDTNQIQTVMHLVQFETVRKMMRIGMLM